MTIVVETGSGDNPAANSYATVEDLRLYAQCRGIDFSIYTDEECEAMLFKAMDWLASKRNLWRGRRTSDTQPLDWPRSDIWDWPTPGALMKSNFVPIELQYGQLASAIETVEHDLLPNRVPETKGAVTREKVGDIEVAYENKGNVQWVSSFAKAEVQINAFYRHGGFTIVRT